MQLLITLPGTVTTVMLVACFYLGAKVFSAIAATKWRIADLIGTIAGAFILGLFYIIGSLFAKNVLHLEIQDIIGIVKLQ